MVSSSRPSYHPKYSTPRRCGGNLLTDYSYVDGNFNYQTTFRGDLKSLLQLEEIYFSDTFVGRQVSTGYLKE